MSHYNPEQTAQLKQIGQYLQELRISQSLTLEDIADRTFISLAVLRSLENGAVEQLPERVYVTGFLRRYGDELGINGKELAYSLKEIPDDLPNANSDPKALFKNKPVSAKAVKTQATSSAKSAQSPSNSDNSGEIGKYWPLLLILALLSGLGGYLFTRRPAPETVIREVPSSVAEVSPLPTPIPSPLPNVVVSPSPSPVVTPEVPLTLVVEITERSWIKVTTDGETAYEGILMPGDQQKWTANQEIRLQTGNAGGVKVSVNEDPLEPLGNSGEVKTANFKAKTLE